MAEVIATDVLGAYVFPGSSGALLFESPGGGAAPYADSYVSVLGDVNADGRSEWAHASRWFDTGTTSWESWLRVHDGASGAIVAQIDSPSGSSGTVLNSGRVVGIGDLDGDDLPDLAIGYPALSTGIARIYGSPFEAAGMPHVYCEAKPSSAACSASIGTSDPSAMPVSGSSDYAVLATQVQGEKAGMLIGGMSGASIISAFGGTLCVRPPLKRSPLLFSGGTGADACDGPLLVDRQRRQHPAFRLRCRSGRQGTALSNAVRLDFQ